MISKCMFYYLKIEFSINCQPGIIFLMLDLFFYFMFCRPQASSAMFFKYNTQLGPPYHIIVDTNFINFSIKNKLEIIQSMMDCLYAKCKYMHV